jgi:DNA (cytosine-5)-methyltransferase 1
LERRISATDSGLWPTPTTQDNVQIRGAGKASNHPRRGTTLGGAARMWPTPNAGSKNWGGTMQEWGGSKNWVRKEMPELASGALNPTWVEWLMAWPLGWTDLKPLETDKCHPARQQHGDC